MSDNGNHPPNPNPMNSGVNPYPRPADGPNFPLIDAVRAHIAAIPTVDIDDDAEGPKDGVAWNQGAWRCETGMCFAGWAAALTGAEFPYPASASGYVTVDHPTDASRLYTNDVMASTVVKDATGKTWAIKEYAMTVLSLSHYYANALFSGDNTLPDIDRVLTHVVAGTDPYEEDDEYEGDD